MTLIIKIFGQETALRVESLFDALDKFKEFRRVNELAVDQPCFGEIYENSNLVKLISDGGVLWGPTEPK